MTLTGHCHCGRAAFEINGELPVKLTRCTCSFCSKRGHLYAYFTPDQLTVTQSVDRLAYYKITKDPWWVAQRLHSNSRKWTFVQTDCRAPSGRHVG